MSQGTTIEEHTIDAPDVSARHEMLEAFEHLGPIEQQIVCVLVQRMGRGQVEYGRFRDDDPRHEPDEMIEEVVDALVYGGRALVKMAKKYAVRDTEPSPAPPTDARVCSACGVPLLLVREYDSPCGCNAAPARPGEP